MKISKSNLRNFAVACGVFAFASFNIAQAEENKDFPNLARFQAENAQIQSAKQDKSRVVFMGDSITQFWDTGDQNIFTNPHFINRGISGQTTSQMLLRFRQDVVALKPQKVVILAGTNDIAGSTGAVSLETIMGNIKSMAEIAKANKIEVVLCKLLPADHYYWSPEIKPAPQIAQLNIEIVKYAKANNLKVIDYYSPMVNEKGGLKPTLSGDGVHPNAEGYKIMKKLIEAGLNK
jgi:lysophospholipase L1-like esterase